jgi:hypothetical protein
VPINYNLFKHLAASLLTIAYELRLSRTKEDPTENAMVEILKTHQKFINLLGRNFPGE